MINSKVFKKRLIKLKRKIIQENLSAFLVSNPINIYYLTGFRSFLVSEREVLLIVDRKKATLFLPRIYQKKIPSFGGLKVKIVKEWAKIFEEISKKFKKYSGKVGFESENLRFDEYKILKKKIPFLPKKDFVADLRLIKEEKEISFIKKTVQITDRTFKKILKFIKPNVTEKQISLKIRQLMGNFGSEGVSFEPIVAFGKNTAYPHHFSGNKRLKKGQAVLLDFGAKFKGYCSDFCRTIYFGKAPKLFKERYKILKEIQEKTFRIIKPGILAKDIYQFIFENLKKERFHFIHGAGHGIGLEAHERPYLKGQIKEKIREGMVLSIEPGIYYQNFGIRIEDPGLVTKKGFKTLSKVKRNLIEI